MFRDGCATYCPHCVYKLLMVDLVVFLKLDRSVVTEDWSLKYEVCVICEVLHIHGVEMVVLPATPLHVKLCDAFGWILQYLLHLKLMKTEVWKMKSVLLSKSYDTYEGRDGCATYCPHCMYKSWMVDLVVFLKLDRSVVNEDWSLKYEVCVIREVLHIQGVEMVVLPATPMLAQSTKYGFICRDL